MTWHLLKNKEAILWLKSYDIVCCITGFVTSVKQYTKWGFSFGKI